MHLSDVSSQCCDVGKGIVTVITGKKNSKMFLIHVLFKICWTSRYVFTLVTLVFLFVLRLYVHVKFGQLRTRKLTLITTKSNTLMYTLDMFL